MFKVQYPSASGGSLLRPLPPLPPPNPEDLPPPVTPTHAQRQHAVVLKEDTGPLQTPRAVARQTLNGEGLTVRINRADLIPMGPRTGLRIYDALDDATRTHLEDARLLLDPNQVVQLEDGSCIKIEEEAVTPVDETHIDRLRTDSHSAFSFSTSPIGCGTDGVVYPALDSARQQAVVIKMEPGENLYYALQEAWLARVARSPAAPYQVLSVGSYVYLELPAMATDMYWARRNLLNCAPQKQVNCVLWITRQVLQQLRDLHHAGYIHRDVKPQNIMCGTHPDNADEMVGGLIDFSLGTHKDADDAQQCLGTLPYIAPEVLQGQGAGPAADMWSLGVTLLEMLSGHNPFAMSGDYHITKSDLRAAHAIHDEFRKEPSFLPMNREAAIATAYANLPAVMRPLVQGLLKNDPTQRVTAYGALAWVEKAMLKMAPEEIATVLEFWQQQRTIGEAITQQTDLITQTQGKPLSWL